MAAITAHRSRRILLVDAVAWSAAYPAVSPCREVHHWYARWLADLPAVTLERVGAENDPVSAVHGDLDGVVVSGSPRDAWSDDPVNHTLMDLVRVCEQRDLPFLGVCYGHQILARAWGGTVARHPGGLELGNTPVTLTDAGRACPLFEGIPARFDVLSSHVDAVLQLPPDAELLVEGAFTSCQGFRRGARQFGVQFHPETDPDTLRFLWSVRRDLWRPQVSFDLDARLDGLQPTPIAANILRNFATHIVA